MKDWSGFWRSHEYDPLLNYYDPLNWSDICWKVNLDLYFDLIKERTNGKEILECGSGSGIFSRYMSKHGYVCTLIDNSIDALNLSKIKFEESQHKASFIKSDINNLPFKDNSFDIIFSGGVIEYFSNVENITHEMVRVLKPSGVIIAAMVPRKFSIQSIADVQRFIVFIIYRIFNYKKKISFNSSIPKNYKLNKLKIKEYVNIFKNTNELINVVGYVITPFPNLSLPKKLYFYYIKFLKKSIPFWNKFNKKTTLLNKIIGISYLVIGSKKI